MELIFQSFAFHQIFHDELSHWAAADVAVADEQNPCHILKPLESIDISGLAGVLRHFLPLILLAYPGIK
jgi:hypothetical protein